MRKRKFFPSTNARETETLLGRTITTYDHVIQ